MKAKAEKPEDWEIVGRFLTYEPYGILLPKDQGDWRDFVDATLVRTIKSGRYQEIYDKWFGPRAKCRWP